MMSIDPSGTIGVVNLPGILSSRIRRQVQDGLQVLLDAGITERHPHSWAYGWGNPIIEFNEDGLFQGPPVSPIVPRPQ